MSADPIESEGTGAAALVSAGLGSLVLGILTTVADHNPYVKAMLIWWKPTGALSGITTASIVVWLGSWAILHSLWQRHPPAMRVAGIAALAMLLLGMALTFPPLIDAL